MHRNLLHNNNRSGNIVIINFWSSISRCLKIMLICSLKIVSKWQKMSNRRVIQFKKEWAFKSKIKCNLNSMNLKVNTTSSATNMKRSELSMKESMNKIHILTNKTKSSSPTISKPPQWLHNCKLTWRNFSMKMTILEKNSANLWAMKIAFQKNKCKKWKFITNNKSKSTNKNFKSTDSLLSNMKKK